MSGPASITPNPGGAGVIGAASCIIFDFDGVVADSEPTSLRTLQAALGRFGLEYTLDEVRAQFLGKSLATIKEHVSAQAPQRRADGFAEIWQTQLFEAFRADLAPMPYLRDTLQGLKTVGLSYCVASSSSFERLGVALDAMKLTDQFTSIFSAEQVARGKPAPDLFLFAAQQMQVPPTECLVIEDSPHGIHAATAAGMRSVGFLGGTHLNDIREEHAKLMMAEGAERVIDSLAALAPGADRSTLTPAKTPKELR